MAFNHAGRDCLLQGLSNLTSLDLVEGDSFKLAWTERKGVLLQLVTQDVLPLKLSAHMQPAHPQQPLPGPLTAILNAYADVFEEPKGLPPARSHDHAIPLQAGAQPVSVRPYRYPFYQKEEIEHIVQDLLTSGVI